MSTPTETKPKTKRPGNTAFKQQRLKAWQPILTPKTVIPTFLIIGAIFIPIGIGLYVASDRVNQVIFDYTDCFKNAPAAFAAPTNADPVIKQWKYESGSKTCSIRFSTDVNFEPPVFIYYRLTNFYQNHRRYVKSFDGNQLKGDLIESSGSLSSNCDPIRDAKSANITGLTLDNTAQYYPCGLIANSFFSDEISNLTCVSASSSFKGVCDTTSASNTLYQFTEKGIAWPSDAQKFAATKWITERPADIPTHLVPPPKWIEAWPSKFGTGYNQSSIPNLGTWERFQVWMRTAGLPTFRKLWGRNDSAALQAATWEISIQDSFDVTRFRGTKSIVISTVSVLGGKNPFLGIAYMVVGVLCVLLGVLFLARHMIKPRKLGDHNLLSWNKDPLAKNN